MASPVSQDRRFRCCNSDVHCALVGRAEKPRKEFNENSFACETFPVYMAALVYRRDRDNAFLTHHHVRGPFKVIFLGPITKRMRLCLNGGHIGAESKSQGLHMGKESTWAITAASN